MFSFSGAANIVTGMVLCRIVYFCRTTPITRSTCIRWHAISLILSVSRGRSCYFPFVNALIFNSASYRPTEFSMSNPWSAQTTSPGSILSKNALFSVKYLSLVLPPQPFDKNISSLEVLCPLNILLRYEICSLSMFGP